MTVQKGLDLKTDKDSIELRSVVPCVQPLVE
jgi:hypothetical protein